MVLLIFLICYIYIAFSAREWTKFSLEELKRCHPNCKIQKYIPKKIHLIPVLQLIPLFILFYTTIFSLGEFVYSEIMNLFDDFDHHDDLDDFNPNDFM